MDIINNYLNSLGTIQAQLSDWQAYTPTFTNFGTPSAINVYWRRNGDNVEIRGEFTAGTVSTGGQRFTMPNSLLSKTSSTSNNNIVGYLTRSTVNETNTISLLNVNGENLVRLGSYVSHSTASTNPLTINTGNLIENGERVSFFCSIPIQGWTANGATNLSELHLIPTGTVIQSALSSPPTGYLPCDGGAYDRLIYADLFAGIGTTFGIGDGSTTFNVPDLKGVFVRGVGTTSGYASNVTIALGEKLDDATQIHQHTAQAGYFLSTTGTANTQVGSGYSTVDYSYSTTGNNNGRTATETRVKSIGLNHFIKY